MGVLAGKEIRPGRFGRSPQFPPEIDFPARVENGLIIGIRIGHAGGPGGVPLLRGLLPRGGSGRLRLGEEFSPGRDIAPAVFLHPGRRDEHILVFLEGRLHQAVEDGVTKLFPPFQVDHRLRLTVFKAPFVRNGNLRTPVVRADGAAGDEEDEREKEELSNHASPPLPAAAGIKPPFVPLLFAFRNRRIFASAFPAESRTSE